MERGLFSFTMKLPLFKLRYQLKRVVVIAIGFAILGCSPKLDWRSVHSERLGYTAFFPEKPKQAERNLPFAGLELKQTLDVAQIDDAIMSVTTIALPATIQAQATALLDQVQANILQSAGTQVPPLVQPSSYLIAGPSRNKGLTTDYLFEIQNPSGKRWMRVRWILRPDGDGGSRIYQQSLLILAPSNSNSGAFQSELTAEKWEPFFNEFRVQ